MLGTTVAKNSTVKVSVIYKDCFNKFYLCLPCSS